jgi:hypothetical protein
LKLVYYLDSKIPKSLESFVKLFYEDFLIYVSSNGLVRVNKSLVESAVKCFCYNIVRSGVYDTTLTITLDKNNYNGKILYNGGNTKRNKVSYKYTRCLLDFMIKEGYIYLEVGGVESWKISDGVWVPDETSLSKIHRLTPLDDSLEPYLIKSNIKTIPNVVTLRNSKGKDVQFKTTPEIKGIIDMLNNYNEIALRHTVMIGDSEYEIQGKKVFNNSTFDEGGRTYYEGGSIQTLGGNIRSTITIDGEQTVGLDYKSLHPAMCAVREGVLLEKDFDPYAIHIDGFSDKLVRSVCKVIMLICINASNGKSAIGAITGKIASDYRKWKKNEDCKWEELHKHPKPFPTKYAMAELTNRNGYLVPYFHTGEGIKLQNLDSKILDNVIVEFLQKDELVLLVHDEVICRESMKDEVYTSMREAYKEVLGTYDNCIIEEK